jgi:CheY-like chemotaxis protein
MSRQLQILLIEENESDAALLQRALENSGLLAQYLVVKTAIEMRETI